MYLGRGDFGTEDLAGHYQALKERFGQADWASEEMMGKATLGVYLMDGLAELKKSGLDVDHLTVPSVSSGS